MKTLLIVSGGLEAVPVAGLAKQLGYYVVVSDRDMQAPAFAHADSCLIADWRNRDETPSAADRFNRKIRKIDGVIGAKPKATQATAETSERLGLAGVSLDAAALMVDKLRMRERLLAAGVSIPWFSPVVTQQALQRIAIERGTPLVVKPADGHSRWARRVARAEDLEQAYQLAREQSPTQRVIAEECLAGPQVTVASVVINSRSHRVAIADRLVDQERAPVLIETGSAMPSALAPGVLEPVGEIAARAVAALGIDRATVQTKLAFIGAEPNVLSVRAGLPDYLWSRQIALSTGIDLCAVAIKAALGEPLNAEDIEPGHTIPTVSRTLLAEPGEVIRIAGEERARDVSGVRELVVRLPSCKKGQLDATPFRIATVVATGASLEAAGSAAREALSLLHIETI